MLANKEFFDAIEKQLRDEGMVQEFEEEFGKIRRRVLVQSAKVPDDVSISYGNNGFLRGYSLSFDVGRMDVFIVVDTKAKKLCMTPMVISKDPGEKLVSPDLRVVNHLVKVIIENIDTEKIEDAPMCIFLNDDSEMVVMLEPKDLEK